MIDKKNSSKILILIFSHSKYQNNKFKFYKNKIKNNYFKLMIYNKNIKT